MGSGSTISIPVALWREGERSTSEPERDQSDQIIVQNQRLMDVRARLRQVIPVTFTSPIESERAAAEAYLEQVRGDPEGAKCFAAVAVDGSLDESTRRACVVQLKFVLESHPEMIANFEFMNLLVCLGAEISDPGMQRALEILSKVCGRMVDTTSYADYLGRQFGAEQQSERDFVWLKMCLSVLSFSELHSESCLVFLGNVIEWLFEHVSQDIHCQYALYYLGKAGGRVLKQVQEPTPFLRNYVKMLILVMKSNHCNVTGFDACSKFLTVMKYHVPLLSELREILAIALMQKQGGAITNDVHRKVLRMMKEYFDLWATEGYEPLSEAEFAQFFTSMVLPGFALPNPQEVSASEFVDHMCPCYGWFDIPSSAYSVCWSLPLKERQVVYHALASLLKNAPNDVSYLMLFNALAAVIQNCREEDGFDFHGFLSGQIVPMIRSGNVGLLMASFRFLSCLPSIVTATLGQDSQVWGVVIESVCQCVKESTANKVLRFLAVAAFSRLVALEIMPLEALSVDIIIPIALDNINSFPTSDNAPIFAEVVKGYMKVLTFELIPVLFEPITRLLDDYILSGDGSDRLHMGVADLLRLLDSMVRQSMDASAEVRTLACGHVIRLLNHIIDMAEGKASSDTTVITAYRKFVAALFEEFVGMSTTVIECSPHLTEDVVVLPDVVIRMARVQSEEADMMWIECDNVSKMIVALLRWVVDNEGLVPRFLDQALAIFKILVECEELNDSEFVEAILVRLRGNPYVLHFSENIAQIMSENEIMDDVKSSIAAAMIVNAPDKWLSLLGSTGDASSLAFYFMLITLTDPNTRADLIRARLERTNLDEERQNVNEYLLEAGVYPQSLEQMWQTLGIAPQ